MATTLCIRSTDCLAGRASFGVRAAPALAPRSPMQQQSQTPATASPPHVAMNSRSVRGRANGQQRRRHRRSPPAAGAGAGSPPHKRVMDNVVILRRGQVLMDKATAPLTATTSAPGPSVAQAVPVKAEAALAGKHADAGVAAEAHRGEREKVDESVAFAKQSSLEAAAAVDQGGAQEEAAETAVAADSIVTDTKEEGFVVTTNQSGAETTTEENEPEAGAGQSGAQAETAEPAAAADQHGPDTREKEAEAAEHLGADAMKAEPAPAAHQTLPLAKEEEEAEQAYSGASFAVVAPDPRALPIPVRLLKPRGRAARFRVLVPDNDRAPAPTA
ncbi:myristoylated alanine-rich C-kinase substrate [Sorghum bicolor]|uniref:myristoylated alanine-rich C-kinase substrate n=1 Tax=Sorghum bicolor TaxID=4558 RepID=UPI0001A83FD9|nr:myristoylated alanine-rich C-kinase substrate [Sorghum bicolor]|eukprot:XP_002462381.1 myristoylated alanine-rich C-kinase substrate [Sorghum bicolor]